MKQEFKIQKMKLQGWWQNLDHNNCSHFRQHSRKSEKWRKKWNMSQEDDLSPGIHLALYFSPSLIWNAGRTSTILELYHDTILCFFPIKLCCQAHRHFARTMYFLRTSVSHWRLPKQTNVTLAATEVWAGFCQRATGDDQCNKLLHWWMICSFISVGKMHQDARTTSIKAQ